MRKFFLAVISSAAVCGTILLAAPAQKTIDSQDTSDIATRADRTFLTKAIEANAAEIELARLAQSKAQNPKVKEFAGILIKDHSDALKRLRQSEVGLKLPPDKSHESGSTEGTTGVALSKENQQLMDRLSKLSGAEFDREYLNAMVQKHEKDIREFEAEANSKPSTPAGSESSPQALARDLLPTLKMHLQEAQALQKEISASNFGNSSSGHE